MKLTIRFTIFCALLFSMTTAFSSACDGFEFRIVNYSNKIFQIKDIEIENNTSVTNIKVGDEILPQGRHSFQTYSGSGTRGNATAKIIVQAEGEDTIQFSYDIHKKLSYYTNFCKIENIDFTTSSPHPIVVSASEKFAYLTILD